MAKLVVEVLDASDLLSEDDQGSASPFVEVDFDDQRRRTQTKPNDLSPSWNEKLVFNISNPIDLPHKTIEVTVHNNRKGSHAHHENFLGRVRISGVSVPLSKSQANVQRYLLDKCDMLSHMKGDIALKIYAVNDGSHTAAGPTIAVGFEAHELETPLQEININNLDHEGIKIDQYKEEENESAVRTFHLIGTAAGGGSGGATAPTPVSSKFGFDQSFHKPPVVESITDFSKAAGPASLVAHMEMPKTDPDEFLPKELIPPVAARMGYRGGDKTASTCDLVEQMRYLYVNVVKARDLLPMDVSGGVDSYVKLKLANYKVVTQHLERNQNHVWKQIFAFSKEILKCNFLEVIVKHEDIGKDNFVGRVRFDLLQVPIRVPPDRPLAPQWYKLQDKKGDNIAKGEIMLAVWMGTQADESFPEAWTCDAHNVSHANLANTRSKFYFSPELYYLRVHVIEARDLVPPYKGRLPDTNVEVQLGNQLRVTGPAQTLNPLWKEELLFVASEPFEDFLFISVVDQIEHGKKEILGRVLIPVRHVPARNESSPPPDPLWFNLIIPSWAEEEGGEKKKEKCSSKILLGLCLEAGYHFHDELTHLSSDLRPSSKHLRKSSIGILELGILSANLLPLKSKDGRTTDAYCVAKYGNKWVRTRTILDTLHPRWNEEYTWEVYDPCTVITIGVFDNSHINGSKEDAKDQRIGKVRIRLSTLETDRMYTRGYPLLMLTPNGLKNNGELRLALRFTCTAWVNMLAQYGKPLLPKMNYVEPIPDRHIDRLRHHAIRIVAAKLGRSEPPLRLETVEYMLDADVRMLIVDYDWWDLTESNFDRIMALLMLDLDVHMPVVDYNMCSLRKSKANFFRVLQFFSVVTAICGWINDICTWRNPVKTILVHALFLIVVCYPKLMVNTISLYPIAIGIWNYRFRPRYPSHMDSRLSHAEIAHPDELDEEFDTFPTTRPGEIVRMRYDRLRSVAGRVQTVAGDLATQGERAQGILSWRDPRATAIFIIFSLICAVFTYVTSPKVVVMLGVFYMLRHPRLRSKRPSILTSFFRRLPSKLDTIL